MITSKKPLSQQKLHKTQHPIATDLKIDILALAKKESNRAMINTLIDLANNHACVFPSQEFISQDYVTRKTANLVMKLFDETNIVRKLNRKGSGVKQLTCMYFLNTWFFDPENRKKYADIFPAMEKNCLPHLMVLFYQGPKDPIKWYLVTASLNNNPLFVAALNMQYQEYTIASELRSKNKHGPPRTLTSPTLA